MKNRSISFLFGLVAFTSTLLYSQEEERKEEPPIPSTEEVERELQEAEAEFKKAKEMINPWYTGPLLAPSSNIVPAGMYNMQPYLFVTDTYAVFDEHGHSHSVPDKLQYKVADVFQFGLTSWMNGVFTPQFINNRRSGHTGAMFGDTTVGLNIALYKETLYYPGVVFAVAELFPTGRYQQLNPRKGGVDATGGGSYQTSFSFNFGKVIWWWFPKHPMRFRLSLQYNIPSNVHVKGINSYGGGMGTSGTVHPGDTFSSDFGYECTLTQNWVAALDIVYSYSLKTRFSGRTGLDSLGHPNVVGGPFNDNLSFAPAIEYNINPNHGFIGGVWFSPWGRNSTKFISGVLSYVATW